MTNTINIESRRILTPKETATIYMELAEARTHECLRHIHDVSEASIEKCRKILQYSAECTNAAYAVSALLGTAATAGIASLIYKNYNWDKHSKLTNFLITGSNSKTQYKKMATVITVYNAIITAGYAVNYIIHRNDE